MLYFATIKLLKSKMFVGSCKISYNKELHWIDNKDKISYNIQLQLISYKSYSTRIRKDTIYTRFQWIYINHL